MNSSAFYFLVGLVLLIVGAFALEYVLSRRRGQTYDLSEAALMFVQAAEQILPGESGEDKLDWVTHQLSAMPGFAQFDPTFVRATIESAVYTLRNDKASS